MLHLYSSPFERTNFNFLWFPCLLPLSCYLSMYILEKGLIAWVWGRVHFSGYLSSSVSTVTHWQLGSGRVWPKSDAQTCVNELGHIFRNIELFAVLKNVELL